MIGLCATCVGEHTKVHTKNHTIPDYENIQNTFQVTDQMLNEKYL